VEELVVWTSINNYLCTFEQRVYAIYSYITQTKVPGRGSCWQNGWKREM